MRGKGIHVRHARMQEKTKRELRETKRVKKQRNKSEKESLQPNTLFSSFLPHVTHTSTPTHFSLPPSLQNWNELVIPQYAEYTQGGGVLNITGTDYADLKNGTVTLVVQR